MSRWGLAAQAIASAPAPVPVAAPAPSSVPAALTPPPCERTSEEWSQMALMWNTYNKADPYRVFQQMSEHGWGAADIAYVSGLSEQAVGDYLTRVGAPAGFGGAVTLGRDAVDADYIAGLKTMDKSQPATALQTYTDWYVSQDTPQARNFVRIHGAGVGNNRGMLHFTDSSAKVVINIQESGEVEAVFSEGLDGRISAYQNYMKMNPLQQAAIQAMLDSPENQEILRLFGAPATTLPNTEMGERMRALYGTELATQMLRLTNATNAMQARYLDALNAAMQTPVPRLPPGDWIREAYHIGYLDAPYEYSPPSTELMLNASKARESGWPLRTDLPLLDVADKSRLLPGWVESEVLYDAWGLGHQQYRFSAEAFHNWYIQQDDPRNKVFGQAYGQAGTGDGRSYKTSGTLEQFQAVLAEDWTRAQPASNPDDSAKPMTTWVANLDAAQLKRVSLSSPPKLYDNGLVYFVPTWGFVTPAQNIKPDDPEFIEQLVPALIVAAVSYVSAGTLGPAAAGAMGLTTTAAATGATVLTTAGVMVSAAVAGAATSMVSGMINGNLSFKGILQGALTAGLFRGVEIATNTPMSSMGTVASIATRTTVQGAVQALMGGSFKDGALAGFASGLGSALSARRSPRWSRRRRAASSSSRPGRRPGWRPCRARSLAG